MFEYKYFASWKIRAACEIMSFSSSFKICQFYISNWVNNNYYASFPLKKEKLIIFKKGLFAHQKKLTEKFQKTIN